MDLYNLQLYIQDLLQINKPERVKEIIIGKIIRKVKNKEYVTDTK